jgi:hypothetical protein
MEIECVAIVVLCNISGLLKNSWDSFDLEMEVWQEFSYHRTSQTNNGN